MVNLYQVDATIRSSASESSALRICRFSNPQEEALRHQLNERLRPPPPATVATDGPLGRRAVA